MAKMEQKKQARRVLKRGDGGAGVGGLLAVGGALAAAALLGALAKHAIKRINRKSLGDCPSREVSEELDCKDEEGASARGLRSLLQTSPPTVPKYQFQASYPREEESSRVRPVPSFTDEFVIAESLNTEKEPASEGKQERPTRTTEEMVSDDAADGESRALPLVEEFSFPVGNPDSASLDSSQVVYDKKEDLFGSSLTVPQSPTKGKVVDIGSQMICDDKKLAENSSLTLPREEDDVGKDGPEDIPMEPEIEGKRDEESPKAKEISHIVSNIIEQEKEEEEEEAYEGAEYYLVDPKGEKKEEEEEASGAENYLVDPKGEEEKEKEEAYEGAENYLVESKGEKEEEKAYQGAENYLVEPKDENEEEEEEEEEEDAYEGAEIYLVEPKGEKEEEEEAYVRAENYLVEPKGGNEEEEEEEAYEGGENYLVEPKGEEEKEEEKCDGTGKFVAVELEKEEAFPGAGICQVEPRENKEEVCPVGGNYQVESIEDHEEEKEPHYGAEDYRVEPRDEKDKEREEEPGDYEKEGEKEEAAFDASGKNQVDGAMNYEVEPKEERREKEAFDGAGAYLVKPKDEKAEEGEAYYGTGNNEVESNVEEKEEGSEAASGDFSTESNVDEKDGEGSDGTGDSSMESNTDVIWPAEFVEGLLQSKTIRDVPNEKQGERANHGDGRYEEKKTEDTEEEEEAAEQVEEDEGEGGGEEEEEDEDDEGEDEEYDIRDYILKQAKENASFETEGKVMMGEGPHSVTTQGKSFRYLSISAVVGFFLFLLLSHLLAESYSIYDYFSFTDKTNH